MNEIIEMLNDWLTWLENPNDSLPSALVEEHAQIGYESRGFSSNRFICRFETENVVFDVNLLMNDRPGEENAAALVKLALIALHTPFHEKVEVRVSDDSADYNGGTLADFLNQIDKLQIGAHGAAEIIYP